MPGDESGATILLVDDQETLLAAVAKMLGKQGFSVLAVTDGAAAVDQLRLHGNRIALLVLDVNLPGLSSREVLEQARRIRPGVPVIVTSAFCQDVIDSFAGLHIDHFIRKPYRLAALVDLLQRVLSAT
jgi:DNA-binding response OmpR family regulator